jgi:TolB-like protein/Tfp pilus assembly protein PilF
MITVHLLGGAGIRSGGEPLRGPPAQRHRIALLAMIVAAWPQSLSRDRATALLWPEKDTSSARRLLNLAVHVLRSSLGEDVILSAGEGLLYNPARVSCDLHDLRAAIAEHRLAAVVMHCTGQLLEGFGLDDSVEFGYWLDERRRELEHAQIAALRSIADQQESDGDMHGRIGTCRRLVTVDPYSSAHTLALMRALEDAGDRPAAIRHAAEYARRLRADLELEPDPGVILFAERLRSAPDTAAPENLATTHSVAVLPFLERSTGGDDYFAEGVTVDVTAHLSRIRALKVISHASAMAFKDRRHSLREIGAALGARTLLDGSVRRSGERIRIVATLVDAATGEQLWAETYDRHTTDVFAIQTDVALRIAEALEAELTREERARVERPPTHDFVAYHLLLQARQWHIQYTAAGWTNAAERLERALIRDPQFALAAANLALVLTEATENGAMPADTALPRAAAAVSLALRVDPELGDAYYAAGFLKVMSDFDWVGAERDFRRALELNPGSADANVYYTRFAYGIGRLDAVMPFLRRAQEIDPLAHRNDLAAALLRAGRLEEARARAEQALELEPEFDHARATLGWSLFLAGKREQGIREMEHAARISPGSTLWQAQLAQAYAISGQEARAREILRELQERSGTGYVSPYHFAYIYTGLGMPDEAIDQLERAVEMRAGPVYAIRGSFLFASLRGHPRYKALMERLGLGEDAELPGGS